MQNRSVFHTVFIFRRVINRDQLYKALCTCNQFIVRWM